MKPTRRIFVAGLTGAGLWAAAPGLASAQSRTSPDGQGWYRAGINAEDYIFHTGSQGIGRRGQRMSDADELRSRVFQDSLAFPPPEGLDAVSIRSKPAARPGGMGTLSRTLPARRFLGKRVRLSANIHTERAGRVQMWMKVTGAHDRVLAFDDMQSRPLRGTTRWRRYSIVLNVPANAVEISYGFLLAGSGAAFANDFALNVTPGTTPVTGQP
ncbi:MAG: hypothetical protein K1X35_04980 [Caulobacteraceae bacterium]|nr:hypothetical protein [Caulobacteraceae bacterium]